MPSVSAPAPAGSPTAIYNKPNGSCIMETQRTYGCWDNITKYWDCFNKLGSKTLSKMSAHHTSRTHREV
jgi:hypothetical protein